MLWEKCNRYSPIETIEGACFNEKGRGLMVSPFENPLRARRVGEGALSLAYAHRKIEDLLDRHIPQRKWHVNRGDSSALEDELRDFLVLQRAEGRRRRCGSAVAQPLVFRQLHLDER
jgi:hypothetical protein